MSEVGLTYPRLTAVLPRADLASVEQVVTLPKSLPAPIRAGEAVGKITYTCQGNPIGEVAITASESAEKLGFWGLWRRIWKGALGL